MQKLYSFTIPKKVTRTTNEITHNEDGSTTTRPVTNEVIENVQFYLKKPNKELFEEAELFHSQMFQKAIQEYQLLPIALLNKRVVDDNGFLADKDKEILNKNEVRGKEILIEIATISQQDDAKSEENQEKVKLLQKELESIHLAWQAMILNKNSLYEYTAEAYISKMSSRWWTLFLSYDEKEQPFFGSGNFQTRNKKFYELTDQAENDEFLSSVMSAFISLVGMWNRNALNSQEEFDDFFNKYIKTNEIDKS